MRHRAGIGMSESSDAIIVIVSEETGSISIAENGMLKRHLNAATAEKLLRSKLLPEENDNSKSSDGIVARIQKIMKGRGNESK